MGVRLALLLLLLGAGCSAQRIPAGPAPQPWIGSDPAPGSFEGFAGGFQFFSRTHPNSDIGVGGAGQVGFSAGVGQGVSLQLNGEYRAGLDEHVTLGRWAFGVRKRDERGLMGGGRVGAGVGSSGPYGHGAAEFGWFDRGRTVSVGFDRTVGASFQVPQDRRAGVALFLVHRTSRGADTDAELRWRDWSP